VSKRVLILNLMVDPDLDDPVAQWSSHFGDVPWTAVHVPSGEPVPALDEVSHLLLTGSEGSLCEPAVWMHVAADLTRRAVAKDLPILGNCFGHQLVVWSLSGTRYVRRAPNPEIGWVEVEIVEEDELLEGIPRVWHAFAFHFDEVFDLPLPWRTLARSADCAFQAIRYGDRPIWGIQPHPEIGPEDARRLMEIASPFVSERAPGFMPLLARAMAQAPQDDLATQQIVDNFLSHSRWKNP
jgi:GMP synthase-like glutamine amidotransferase